MLDLPDLPDLLAPILPPLASYLSQFTLDTFDTFDTLCSLLAMLVAPFTAAALILALYLRWSRSQRLLGRLSGRLSGGVASLGEVVMAPLEVDLSQAPTFVTLPALPTLPAQPPSALRSAFPTYTPPSLPPTPTIPPVGSSLAVLDWSPLDNGGAHGCMDDDDPDWPPAPRMPGAKTYRFVLASGELVRLRNLRRMQVRPLPPHACN